MPVLELVVFQSVVVQSAPGMFPSPPPVSVLVHTAYTTIVPEAFSGIVYLPPGFTFCPVPSLDRDHPVSVYPACVTPVSGRVIASPGFPVVSLMEPVPPLASYRMVTAAGFVVPPPSAHSATCPAT